jgi:hypothetical protein
MEFTNNMRESAVARRREEVYCAAQCRGIDENAMQKSDGIRANMSLIVRAVASLMFVNHCALDAEKACRKRRGVALRENAAGK